MRPLLTLFVITLRALWCRTVILKTVFLIHPYTNERFVWSSISVFETVPEKQYFDMGPNDDSEPSGHSLSLIRVLTDRPIRAYSKDLKYINMLQTETIAYYM